MRNEKSDDIRVEHELKPLVKEKEDDAEHVETEHSNDKETFIHRLLHTMCVCSCTFALGWRNALLGPTLLDLSLITGTDLSTISTVFTAKAIGGLVGSVCGGFAYDRLNKIGLFVTVMTVMGITAIAVPWCSHIAAMLIVHVGFGCIEQALIVTSADIAAVWKQNAGPFMQALHGSFSIGSFISPFVCESFLAKKVIRSEWNSTTENITSHHFLQNTESNTTIAETTSELTKEAYSETQIYIPYIIAGCVCFLVSICFIISKLTLGEVYKYTSASPDAKNSDGDGQYVLSHRLKWVYTLVLAVSLAMYSVCEYSVPGFLVAFVNTELNWSKSVGSNILSVFWIAFTVGRFTGIFVVKRIRTGVVLIAFFTVCIIGAVLLLSSVVLEIHILVWVSIATLGYGQSVIVPSLFTWLSENIRVLTGKVSCVMCIIVSVGNMTIPILIGNLMDKLSQMWFIYSVIILFAVNLSLFTSILASFVLLKSKRKSTEGFKLNVSMNCIKSIICVDNR